MMKQFLFAAIFAVMILPVRSIAKSHVPADSVAIGQAAPAFKLKDFSGKEVSLSSLKGKIVVLDFWAT